MKLSKVFMGTVMFLALMTGVMQIHQDMNDRHGIENNKTVSMQKEYDDMKAAVYGEDHTPGVEGGCGNNQSNCGLYENVRTLSRPTEDLFSTGAAALFTIPSLMSFLVQPIQVLTSAVGTIQGLFPEAPGWIGVFANLIIVITITFGIVAAIIRWKL